MKKFKVGDVVQHFQEGVPYTVKDFSDKTGFLIFEGWPDTYNPDAYHLYTEPEDLERARQGLLQLRKRL